MTKGAFTKEYPESNYTPTLNSTHPQSKYWPSYLPIQDTRLFIFERSKNAQLVVYTANYRDAEQKIVDPKWPLDINWQSFGWTKYPTSNGTGMLERKMAWGYKHQLVQAPNVKHGTKYQVTLSAMPQRKAFFYIDQEDVPTLETTIGGEAARLQKIFVKTSDSHKFIPTVEYVEIFGISLQTRDSVYEKYIP